MSSLQGYFDDPKPLYQIALGYKQSQFIGTQILRTIETEADQVKVPIFPKDGFTLFKTERAIRADSNRAELNDMQYIDVSLKEHDLGFPLDWREQEASRQINLIEYAIKRATESLNLEQERKASELLFNPNTFDDTHHTQITENNKKWDSADSNPFDDVENAKDVVSNAIGIEPNTMVLGESTYKALKVHTKIIDKVKYSQLGIVTIDLLKQLFEVDNILIGKGIYKPHGQSNFTKLWNDSCLMTYINPDQQVNEFSPSIGFNFERFNIEVVKMTISANYKVITPIVTKVYTPYVTMPTAGFLITNTRTA